MNRSHQGQQHEPESMSSAAALVVPLDTLDRTSLPVAGGKAANLGELIHAGFAVPAGCCVTTAAYSHVSARAGLDTYLSALEATESSESARLIELATAIRTALCQTPLPPEVIEAVTSAYQDLSAGLPIPVSVRSSATAEDLPDASFAGQQETFLNVIGIEAVLTAVQRCFASLWTDRATQYRASLGIDQRSVQLAVVVQRMIESAVSGVLFTANPLTGKRRQAVIDANPGLGEAVVSGATNPDHFVVNTATAEIAQRRLGDKRVIIRGIEGGGTTRTETSAGRGSACLSDEQVRTLAALGAQVEAHYGAPQDTEWAIDSSGKLWLVQSRPITTLYPLPDHAPDTDDVLRVYFSLNVFQGVYRPLTPMGIALFRLFGSTIAGVFNLAPRDPLRGPSILVEAGGRLFFDVTSALRTAIGRKFLQSAAQVGEAPSAPLFQQLTTDPRLSLVPTPRWSLIRAFGSLLEKTRAPIYVIQALLWPSTVQKRMVQMRAWLQSLNDEAAEALVQVQNRADLADLNDRLTALEQRLPGRVKYVFRAIPVMMISGLGSYALSGRLLEGIATHDEMQIVLRGLPHNPTTEMDLELWALAQRVQADAVAAQAVREMPPERLAQQYREGTLPPTLQLGLGEFLQVYGHRGVAEIDL